MTNDPEKHHRRSIRLRGYDYTRVGAYFVTICTQNQECLFGEVSNSEMRLSELGQIVQACWIAIPEHSPHIELDAFVVMPNHVHGIIVIEGRGTACRAPTTESFGQPVTGSLPTVVRSFKSAVTKRINEIRGTPGTPVWQRDYYEHVIRSETELNLIRQYILDNPLKWELDRENPHGQQQSREEPWEV